MLRVVVCVAVVGAAVDSRVVVVLEVVGVGFSTVVQEVSPRIPRHINEVMMISFFMVGLVLVYWFSSCRSTLSSLFALLSWSGERRLWFRERWW